MSVISIISLTASPTPDTQMNNYVGWLGGWVDGFLSTGIL